MVAFDASRSSWAVGPFPSSADDTEGVNRSAVAAAVHVATVLRAYEVHEMCEAYVREVLDIASPPGCRSLSAYVLPFLVAFLPFFQ
jgi:hypothetical protein